MFIQIIFVDFDNIFSINLFKFIIGNSVVVTES